jgi:hypothetical protein
MTQLLLMVSSLVGLIRVLADVAQVPLVHLSFLDPLGVVVVGLSLLNTAKNLLLKTQLNNSAYDISCM